MCFLILSQNSFKMLPAKPNSQIALEAQHPIGSGSIVTVGLLSVYGPVKVGKILRCCYHKAMC